VTHAIFLSASVPDPKRAPNFAATADAVAITAAVSALLHVTLGRRPLVWGGHPAITPMIWVVAQDLGVDYGRWVRLYQSNYFEDEFPEDNERFRNVRYTDSVAGDREQSLHALRTRMFTDVQYAAAVFIGVQTTRRRPRGGFHPGVDGRGDARPGQGRDRAHRLPLSGTRCGSGNFLVQVLRRKLAAVELKYGKSDFERRHYALLALMCIYGIELLADNIAECRANLLEILAEYLELDEATTSTARRVPCAVAEPRPWRRARDAEPTTAADHLRRVGLPGQGQVPAARLPPRRPDAVGGLQRGGLALRPLGKHEIFTPTKDLPADDGA
jgi:hypothetical protein